MSTAKTPEDFPQDRGTIRVTGRLQDFAPESTCEADPPPTRLARQLALAHLVERLVEAGELPSYADAARRLGVTRARLSQVLRLRYLSPEIQARILKGSLRSSERALRVVTAAASWAAQHAALGEHEEE